MARRANGACAGGAPAIRPRRCGWNRKESKMTKQVVDPDTGELLFAEGEEPSEAKLVSILPAILDLQRRSKKLGSAYSDAKEPYLAHLIKNGEKALRDGETGTTALLQQPTGEECDVATMAKNDPDAVLEAARRGLVRLDIKGFQRQKETFQEGAIIDRYISLKPMTARLVIQQER